MANELSTVVPGAERKAKGFDRMLTQEDIAFVISRPVRWVREKLLKTGVIKSVRFGGNSYRVTQANFAEFIAHGNTGFRSSPSSGRRGSKI